MANYHLRNAPSEGACVRLPRHGVPLDLLGQVLALVERILGPSTTEGDRDLGDRTSIGLAMFLFREKQWDLLETLINIVGTTSPVMHYFRGQSLLHQRDTNPALKCFVQVSELLENGIFSSELEERCCNWILSGSGSSSSSSDIPLEAESRIPNLVRLYARLISEFERAGDLFACLELSRMAVQCIRANDVGPDQESLFESNIIRFAIPEGYFDEAYASLVRLPRSVKRTEYMRQLVIALCSSGKVEQLVNFPWDGVQDEFMSALKWASDSTTARVIAEADQALMFDESLDEPTPDYAAVMYGWLIQRGDFFAAARSMYSHVLRLRKEIRLLSTGSLELLIRALIATLTALRAAPGEHCLLKPVPVRSSSRMDCNEDGEGSGDSFRNFDVRLTVEILQLEDIEKELEICIAQRELIARESTINFADSSADDVVSALIDANFLERAVSLALSCGCDLDGVIRRCARMCAHFYYEGDYGQRRTEYMRQLVIAFCSSGKVKQRVNFPWDGVQDEFMSALKWASDSTTARVIAEADQALMFDESLDEPTPDYAAVMYGWLI
eukprot:831773_1